MKICTGTFLLHIVGLLLNPPVCIVLSLPGVLHPVADIAACTRARYTDDRDSSNL